MPVDSGEIYMHLHMTTMELDARQGGAMALYGPKVAPPVTVKNPNPKVVYDEYNNERYSPGDPSKRGFAYFALNGGRFIYCVSSY